MAVTDTDPTPTTPGPLGRRWGCLVTLSATVVLVVPALGASKWVLGLADRSGGESSLVLDEAFRVFVVWLSLPLAFLLAGGVRAGWRRMVVAVFAATVLSLAVTAWTVRPQAPTGGDAGSFEDAVAAVDRDIAAALDEVAPGQWSRGEQPLAPQPCTDRFGRDRGAIRGGPRYTTDRPLTDARHRRLIERLDADHVVVEPGSEDRPHVTVIRVLGVNPPATTIIDVETSCLRPEAPVD